MSKKHFKALAEAIRDARPSDHQHPEIAWRKLVIAVAEVCQSTNRAFDRNRFLTACGLTTNER